MGAAAGPETGHRFATDPFDERRAAPAAYEALIDRRGEAGLRRESDRIAVSLRERGVRFGDAEVVVDPIPRVLEAGEWERIEAGLAQRVRALNAFIADVYGDRRIVAAGVVPERLIETADRYEPAADGLGSRIVAAVAGPDLIRSPDGSMLVVEDNLRAPSGLAYLLALRESLEPLAASAELRPRSLEPALEAFAGAIEAATPACASVPARTVLLHDGRASSARYEHRALAARFGMTPATAGELRRRGDELLLGDERVDVVYRRVDDERLTGSDGHPTGLGELLGRPLRAGRLGCINSPGTGIGDDKAIHVYVESMIRFYLDEEPRLGSVPGFDLGDPGQLAAAEPRLEELVIKPRPDFGGRGVMIGPIAEPEERRRAIEAVQREPERYVAQEPVRLSTHPTLTSEGVAGRHVDLRPYVVTAGEAVTVLAGGLSRFGREEGEMVVNSGQGGGVKDTWVL
jgi:carboxylate-amine ligase